MSTTNGKPRYSYEIHICAPTDRVWKALYDGDLTEKYVYGTRFEGKLVKGSPYAFVGDKSFRVVDGKVLEVVPPKRLVLSWSAHWDAEVEKDRPSRVTYELEATDAKMTCLHLTHDEFDNETATYLETTTGWPRMLSSLKTLLESGASLPVR